MNVFSQLEQSTRGKPWRMKLGKLTRRLLPNFDLQARLFPLKVQSDKSRFAGTLDASSREFLKHVDSRVSPSDDMYSCDPARYWYIGLSGMRCVERILEKVPRLQIKNVLDLPCGYGRVLRFLVERFPNARLTACDFNRHAVDFCVRTFQVRPAYSAEDFRSLNLGEQFDLIWCGSLITHLDSQRIQDLLCFFGRHLSSDGVVVLTAHGDEAIKILADFSGVPEHFPQMVREYSDSGFSYRNYPGLSNYGLSLTSSEWIRKEASVAMLREVRFEDSPWWCSHDVFVFGHQSPTTFA
jgi:SAM-dependent methyltransferase